MTTMMIDPLDAAVLTAENAGKYYGQVNVSAAFVVLTKGIGKQAFIDGAHNVQDRRTEISFTLNPIEEMGMTNLVQRSMLSESAEWSKIVWPSLRDGCGLNSLRALDGKYVKVELVKNGRTWPDRKTGEIREGTTLKFVAVYKTDAECKAAFVSDGNAPRTTTNSDNDAAMDIDMSAGSGAVVNNNQELEMAKAFLPALVKASGGNKEVLVKNLAGMFPVSKYFTIDSPEVKALLAA